MSFLRGREVHLSVILIIALLGVLSGWAIGCHIPMRPENNMPAFWGLLLNNVKVGGMVIVAGLLTLGVGALFLVGFNMMILGASTAGVYATSGIGPILSGVLPHAPCEIVAMVMCALVGFEGWRVIAIFKERLVSGECVKFNVKSTAFLVLGAIVMYVLAALLESGISHAQTG